MSYLTTVVAEQPTGSVLAIFDSYRRRLGAVPNIVLALGAQPDTLQVAERLRLSIGHGHSGLGARREELIAVRIADSLRCHY